MNLFHSNGKNVCILLIIIFFWYIFIFRKDDLTVIESNPVTWPTIIQPSYAAPTNDEKTVVDDRGFWKGLAASKHHLFDKPLSEALITFLKNEDVNYILELGAGTGEYARCIKEAGIFISCYDGNPQTQDLSKGRCGVLDFSKPLRLSPHEWVLSFEVGEHIPAKFENTFIENLHNLNQKGILLSWAIIGQDGLSHVNNRKNSYIRDKFHSLGYDSDFVSENLLRNSASLPWFKNTIMVFRRKT